jgi:hypothetical protein
MSQSEIVEQIEDDDVILRRVRNTSDAIRVQENGQQRATSFAMRTRPDEEYLSCSLLRITSPKKLLGLNQSVADNTDDWKVCCFHVSDVRAVGYEIHHKPTDEDDGHCGITGENGLPIPNQKLQKLAKRTRILTDEEIEDPSLIS